MTDRAKRTAALLLIAGALLLAAAAWWTWKQADDDAYKNPYNAAFGLADPPPADHTPSVIMLVAGGLAIVCATILLSTSHAPERIEIDPALERKQSSESWAGWGGLALPPDAKEPPPPEGESGSS